MKYVALNGSSSPLRVPSDQSWSLEQRNERCDMLWQTGQLERASSFATSIAASNSSAGLGSSPFSRGGSPRCTAGKRGRIVGNAALPLSGCYKRPSVAGVPNPFLLSAHKRWDDMVQRGVGWLRKDKFRAGAAVYRGRNDARRIVAKSWPVPNSLYNFISNAISHVSTRGWTARAWSSGRRQCC